MFTVALLLAPVLADSLTPLPSIDRASLVVTDIDGVSHDGRDFEAVVVVFLKPGCPIANYYHPTMRRLVAAWGERVLLVQVHATASVTAEQAREHRTEYDVAGVVCVDASQTLARTLGAKATPEAFVLRPTGEVMSRGRIDDTYVGFGRRRQTVGDHTLREAVDAVLAGRPVPSPQTEAVGCRIHYAAAESP